MKRSSDAMRISACLVNTSPPAPSMAEESSARAGAEMSAAAAASAIFFMIVPHRMGTRLARPYPRRKERDDQTEDHHRGHVLAERNDREFGRAVPGRKRHHDVFHREI